jgi:hypothetical protein
MGLLGDRVPGARGMAAPFIGMMMVISAVKESPRNVPGLGIQCRT